MSGSTPRSRTAAFRGVSSLVNRISCPFPYLVYWASTHLDVYGQGDEASRSEVKEVATEGAMDDKKADRWVEWLGRMCDPLGDVELESWDSFLGSRGAPPAHDVESESRREKEGRREKEMEAEAEKQTEKEIKRERDREEMNKVKWDDTLLVLNTGAHWSRGTMCMIPEVGTYEEQRGVMVGLYRDLVRLLPLPHSSLLLASPFSLLASPFFVL
ncbi:hypothetical protein NMY22_g3229 [Coprinellus aureogranulatus]|nr:hypothetical protein NMY22_g3229 [Coprinellus aureogranulatus]